ncbi:Pyrroline-5-carboxylate reductase 3 [Halotydeus destructor]|nr:Pyrroline-5-carboxylate reductase 3 [Halotydeus destructor]
MSSGSKSKSKSRKNDPELKDAKIGFIGGGKMTEMLVTGLINFAKIEPAKIFIAAPTDKNLDKFKSMGIKTTKRNIDIFGRYDCDVVFLSVHGAVVADCYKLGGTRPHPITVNYIPNMKHPIHVLSMISGWDVEKVKKVLLNPEHPDKYLLEIHRIVVNAAVAYGAGISAVDCEPDSAKLSPLVRTLLSSVSTLEHVPESQMDAACAILGAGLAFTFYFISSMADGAFKMGLSRPMAVKLAAKTVLCAAQSQLESGKHPGELRDAVCAPKGAAIYGIHILDKAEVQSGITAAVEAAHKRAQELAQANTN